MNTKSYPRPSMVFAHTVEVGNDSKNVANSLRTRRSVAFVERRIRSVNIPPGFRCDFTESKYSFE